MEYEQEKIIVYVMQSIFCLVGTVGNSLVLYIYLRKKDKSTSSIFIIALAGTDFVTCVFIIPFNIATLYLDYRHGNEGVCQLYMFLIAGNVPFATLIMVAIAFDRYFCICHPFLHVITIFRAKVIIVILGICACTLGTITALIYGFKNNVSSPFNSTYISNTTFTPLTNSTRICVDSDINCRNISHHIDSSEVYTGVCEPVYRIFSEEFVNSYVKVHAILYVISFLFVAVLYSLIYREIHVRRARKAKRKRSSLYPLSQTEQFMVETQLTVVHGTNGNTHDEPQKNSTSKFRKIGANLKEKQFYANIRTAAMLFIVTLVFMVAFFPALLMAQTIVTYNVVVFYMYFISNTANPVIYSFMNKSFRKELRAILTKVCILNKKADVK